jgi:small subunit ribosomal protein S17
MRRLKKVVGTVVSASMNKTVVVEVQRVYVHSKYRRILQRRHRYFAHDEHDICGVGDKVQIWPVGEKIGSRSSRKTWAVVDMLHRQARLAGEPCTMSALLQPGQPIPASHPQMEAAETVIAEREAAQSVPEVEPVAAAEEVAASERA